MYLYFRGKIDDDVNRFHINLQCGEKKGCTKALHFNPRFQPSEVVVFNTFQKGRWETEERVKTMPFRKGEKFELLFIVTSKGYQVIVNGHQFYMFKHRIPVEQSIPHVGPVYGGLRTGMFVFFRGTVPQEIKRFHINLQYGELKGCDKALHFNPRFDPSEVVVFNTFRNGSWENEERVDKMPFSKGENFEVVFIITSEGYQVNVNGRQFYLFKHRMPVEYVSAIKIAGDVSMQTLNMIEGGQGVEGSPSQGKIAVNTIPHVGPLYGGLRPGMALSFQGTIPEEIHSFAIILQYGEMKGCDKAFKFNARFEPSEMSNLDVEVIPGGLKTGMAAYFKGTIPNKIKSFTISLQCGDSKDSEKALHFKALFEPSEGIVLNSFKDGSWETEERVNEMPFTKGESFELVFHATSEGYQVYVNRRRIYLFKHRIPLEQVCSVQIIGDVSMQTTNYIDLQEVAMQQGTDQDDTEVTTVPGTLKTGMSMSFQGAIPDEITSFSIDLQYGDTDGCDSAFHFSPQFEPSQNGSWETEERVDKMPFSKGEKFDLVYIITSEGYQVNVNGTEFYLFKHRIPVEQVRALQIAGDVSIQTTHIIEGAVQEYPSPAHLGTIQCEIPIPGNLKTGMSMTFQGSIPDETNRFSINMQCGDTEGCDTAFHFSPQFETSDVVFNTFRNGSWETEERVNKMPFSKGEKFELVYKMTSEGYQVNVNGQLLYLFKYRMAVEQVAVVQCGEADGCDIVFRFNPEFKTSEVLFNSFKNGSWEQEERVTEMPFHKGGDFELVYIITSEGYQVNVNGQKLHLFKHRIPAEQANALQITGNVNISSMNIIEGCIGGETISVHCGNQKLKVFVNGKRMFDSINRLQPFTKTSWRSLMSLF
ncbi:hypothetical protein SKAU_G00087270 [Synaphobranchus kaupii]|uniref:Galectin domain-containing protein n=1 Tax=Synaphobranchus kaupii TaxID=118154 RepID=A0A9Q1FWI5_SYNKA|nr:hypothetical protein SKAU_G00087270 [Synaphobranchus kaupii]